MQLSKTKTDIHIDETINKLVVHSNFLRLYSDETTILADIPVEQINSILIFGSNFNIPTRLIKICNEYQIPLHLMTDYYKHNGSIYFSVHKNIKNRVAQFQALSSNKWKIYLSKLLLFHKFETQKYFQKDLKHYKKAQEKLESKKELMSLMGLEGLIASLYWEQFGNQIPQNFNWNGRIKNPCLDPINSLLSLGYALLSTQCQSGLTLHGLDPYCGILHMTNDDRPALVYDIMEIFRVLIVDVWVLELFKSGKFKPEDFVFTAKGICTLRADKKNEFFRLWYKRLKYQKFSSTVGMISIHDFLIILTKRLIELFNKINQNQLRDTGRYDRLSEYLPTFLNQKEFICAE